MTLQLDADYKRLMGVLQHNPRGNSYRLGRTRNRQVVENDFPIEGEGRFYRASHETVFVYSSDPRTPTIYDDFRLKRLELSLGFMDGQTEECQEELLVVQSRISFMRGIDFRTNGPTLILQDIQRQIISTFPKRTKEFLDLAKEFSHPLSHSRTLSFDVQGQKKRDTNSYDSF